MEEAKQNYMTIGVKKHPLIHLKGHVSQCFDIVQKQYTYCPCPETTPEKFAEACKKYGISYRISESGIYFEKKADIINITSNGRTITESSACIFVDNDGNVFLNDSPFTIEQQLKENKSKNIPER